MLSKSRYTATRGLSRSGMSLLTGIVDADEVADLVERGHDRDGLVDRQHVGVGAALGEVPLGRERLELHAAAVDVGTELLDHRPVGADEAERRGRVPDAVDVD